MSRRTKRRLALGVLFAGLCVLALIGLVMQSLGSGRGERSSRKDSR
jgi:hypothetical protein